MDIMLGIGINTQHLIICSKFAQQLNFTIFKGRYCTILFSRLENLSKPSHKIFEILQITQIIGVVKLSSSSHEY